MCSCVCSGVCFMHTVTPFTPRFFQIQIDSCSFFLFLSQYSSLHYICFADCVAKSQKEPLWTHTAFPGCPEYVLIHAPPSDPEGFCFLMATFPKRSLPVPTGMGVAVEIIRSLPQY